jgi:hypothetical protein
VTENKNRIFFIATHPSMHFKGILFLTNWLLTFLGDTLSFGLQGAEGREGVLPGRAKKKTNQKTLRRQSRASSNKRGG